MNLEPSAFLFHRYLLLLYLYFLKSFLFPGPEAAKPATKRNDVVNRGTANAHRHGCFSLMKMVKEWAELNCEEVFVFSVDDKAKVFLIFQNLYFCVLILFSPRSSSGSLFSID